MVALVCHRSLPAGLLAMLDNDVMSEPSSPGACMRCRPCSLYRSLCSESLQVSKRLKLDVTTSMAMVTGMWPPLIRATIARRAISLLLWHRTALLTLARPPQQSTFLVQSIRGSARQGSITRMTAPATVMTPVNGKSFQSR
jgi:hypothetical protein